MPENFGKMLVIFGVVLVIVGLVFVFSNKMGGFIGQLPGDMSYQGKGFSFYFPLATSIILSILLTLLLNGYFWISKK